MKDRKRRHMLRRAVRGVALLLLIAAALTANGYRHARADPVVRQATVRLPGWPAGAAPVRVLLWSDLHSGNAATDRARLRRLVAAAEALHPDLVILAGDYVAGHRQADAAPAAAMLGEVGRLRPPLGIVAVMGNHEYWTDAPRLRRALAAAGVTVLRNTAVRRGPLAIGGIDDMVTRHANPAAAVAAVRQLGGAPVLVSHSPDIAPRLPADMPLLLAGHSHCGQIVLPLIGALVQVTQPRYRCGAVREGARLTIVTAGTGTSVAPLRYGAPADWWLLTLTP
ncbi:metallophosphoesterase [Sphingomonas sp.]|uniref:metallophosphoesterase n=1 Tax=Sphingomonas sp. TaxID=28214 RepID=UPI003CC51BCA